jgi:3-hydroxyisobutyrate dehydrogenase-like beta-hydroxyacid dehydrogenase
MHTLSQVWGTYNTLRLFGMSTKQGGTRMLRVGFVGLGRMGRGMARRILRGGHDLIVYNRTANHAADLASEGASVAPSIAAACADRDVVITMLADDAALDEVALGAGGCATQ